MGGAPGALSLAALASKLHGPGGRFPSHLQALLAAQLHHAASCAFSQAGDCIEALQQSQQALRVSSSLYQAVCGSSSTSVGVSSPEEQEGGQIHAQAVPSSNGDTAVDMDVDDDVLPVSGPGPELAAPGEEVMSCSSRAAGAARGSRHGGAAGELATPVFAQYLCSLLRSASTFEALGCPEDAVCLLKECRGLARALWAGQIHAAAALQLAQIECRRGALADVVTGYLQEAAANLQSGGAASSAQGDSGEDGRAASSSQGDSGGRSGNAYLHALSSRIQGDLYLREGKGEAAGAAYMGGLVPLATELKGSTACTATGGAGPTAAPGILPSWRAELGAVQSSLWLGAAEALLVSAASTALGAAKLTSSELRRKVDQMLVEARACLMVDGSLVLEDDDTVPTRDRGMSAGSEGGPAGPDTAWRFPTQLGEVLLRRGLLSQSCALLQRPLGSAPSEAWVAGIGAAREGGCSSSSASLLELRFDAALRLDSDDLDAGADAGRKATGRRGAAGGKGKGAASACMISARNSKTRPTATASDRSIEASSVGDDVSLLIEVLLHCWATPSLAARALAGLTAAALSSGHLHAAAMCLHLSTGTSLLHQTRMALQPREATSSSSVAGGEPQGPGVGRPDGVAEREISREMQLCRCSDMMSGALAVFREAAAGVGDSCRVGGGVREGRCGDRDALLGRLDRLAQPWLRNLLSWLQPGAVVCSLTLNPDGRLLVGRLEPGRTPLMVLLPEGGATARDEAAGKGTPGAGQSLLAQLLARLAEIMQRSAESMRGGGGTAEKTPAQKLEWWQVRAVAWQVVPDVVSTPSTPRSAFRYNLIFFSSARPFLPTLLLLAVLHPIASHLPRRRASPWTATCSSCRPTWATVCWGPGGPC